MDYNLNNYLEEVVSPALDPTQYAQGMTNMVKTINANFRKIIGLPFIQGDAGESVVIIKEYIYEAGMNYDAFTDFGKELVKAIYKDYLPDDYVVTTYSDLREYLSENNEDKFDAQTTGYSCDFLEPKTVTDIYNEYQQDADIRDDRYNYITMQSVGEKKVSDSIYFFADLRTTEEHLEIIMGNPENSEMRQQFDDRSCGIYCLYENGQWTIIRNYMLPRFYWDEDLSMFCWKLNNLKTHVTAQGIPGEAGQSAKMYICKGTASVDVNTTPYRIVLDSIWDPTSDPDNPNWAWVTIPDDISLKNSIIGVWFKQQGSAAFDGFVIGVADKEDNDWVMYYQDDDDEGGINMDFQSIINHFTLKTLLDQVGLRDASTTLNDDNENTPARARGLYIRESINSTDPDLEEPAHIFAMSDAILNTTETAHPVLTPAPYRFTNTSHPDERMDLQDQEPGNLTVNYNTNVKGTSQALVCGVPDVYLGVPIGTILMWPLDVGYKFLTHERVVACSANDDIFEMTDGWLLCNGAIIPEINDFARLRNICGGFLPDFRQKFPLGAQAFGNFPEGYPTNIWNTGGESTHKLSQDEMPEHTHVIPQSGEHSHTATFQADDCPTNTLYSCTNLGGSDARGYFRSGDTGAVGVNAKVTIAYDSAHTHTINNAGGDRPHNNIPPFYAINFIIKYK